MSSRFHTLFIITAAVTVVLSSLAAMADTPSAGYRAALKREIPSAAHWKTGAIVRDKAGNLVLDPKARAGGQLTDRAAGKSIPTSRLPLGSGCPIGGVQTAEVRVPSHIDAIVRKLAPKIGIDPHLVFAVIKVESNFQTKAVSPKNAQGLMQLIPGTAKRFGVRDPFDPSQNIRGGMTYLRWLLDEFNGSIDLALAGYNAGEKAVERHRGIPPYRETQDYVRKVMGHYGCGTGRANKPAFTEAVYDGPRRGWHSLGPQTWDPVREPYDLWNAARRGVDKDAACGSSNRGGWAAFGPKANARCQ